MQYKMLGGSDLRVSRIALGTMTFGSQNTEAQAWEQLDYAAAAGVNLLDTAEMYPVPTSPDYQGASEAIIGRWMQARGNREQMIVATKVTGPGDLCRYIRPDVGLSAASIRDAIEGSLRRLQTDYVDLYQLHWPERQSNFFGQLGYVPGDVAGDGVAIEETLRALKTLVDDGRVRYVGLSNETAWGTMEFLRLADKLDLPRVVSVQNPYSLLNRSLEVGLAEVMLREQVDLLAYSPLAFGVLSGKYLDGARPDGSRLQLYPSYQRYLTEQGQAATRAYVALAKDAGLDPSQMALAYVNSRPFLGSNIIGASKMDQLRSNIASLNLALNDDVLAQIEAIHACYTYPCP
ncbi:NADP(H)-dependent aldo-keto reductase [Marinobacterium sedimentorum]|uniref:NADP(H)-dependent aldo-keto reductase n=1 Tax=Marinobacterium sedimentorum TaxID=2927804 RepID=UPI0020C62F11|nr:NADP(H)-dependent aldo-keto reductase [Marinobacterium sedimentorum]MCP8688938.1 NADP(H)-dependent aldo-keto reductase [Marinobacterium sedimentorum]